jgi:DNA mismatch repair ATPase MutL
VIFRLVQKSVENAFHAPIPASAPSPLFRDTFSDTIAAPLPFRFEAADTPQDLPLQFSGRALTVIGPYLLLQEERLLLVDLQAAHSRVLFESLTVAKPISQALLFPLEIKMEADEEMLDALHQLGVECRLLKKTLVIDALPEMLQAEHFPQFLEQWQQTGKIELASAAVSRISKTWQLQDAMHLFRQVQKCRDTLYDPLGRPIWMELQITDLMHMMSRKGKT